MKIGILLHGYFIRNRDWNRTKDSVKEKIIQCWGPDTEVHLALGWQDVTLENYYNAKSVVYKNTLLDKIIAGLESIRKHNLDFIIVTRLDAIFFKKLSDLNFNFNKYNFLFKEFNHWDRPKVEWWDRYYTSDNLIAFPSKYIDATIGSIIDSVVIPPYEHVTMHTLYSYLVTKINEDNIHFLTDEHMKSGSGGNKFYLLDRYDIIKGDMGPTSIEDFLKERVTNKLIYQGDVFN